jgi:lipoprotein-releasing system permease protein
VNGFSEVVEGNALLRYEDRQKYAIVKGVQDDFENFSGLDSMMYDGQFLLHKDGQDCAVIGQGVKIDLSVGFTLTSPIHVYVPKKDFKSRINFDQSLNHGYVFPTGSFSVEQEIDSKYILVPIAFARKLFEMEGLVTSLELKLKGQADPEQVKSEVQKILGNCFVVQDKYEQHAFLYKVMRSEKWTSFLILSFILVIASFNLLGSLTMIILDKKDDIKILESMGANKQLIRRIFLFEGWMISFSGALSGLLLGIGLVWAQTRFELLKLPSSGSFALSAYPVELHFIDVLATFLIVLLIGFFAAWYPVRSLAEK